jgi:hypothetical protein
MAQFDLNQPISWEEEEIVEEYAARTDKEEHVDVAHGGAGDGGDGAEDGQGRETDHRGGHDGNGSAGSDADGCGAGGFGGVASDADSTGRGLDLSKSVHVLVVVLQLSDVE